jgi:hypothetical protein
VATPISLRKARSVTDTSGHLQFLGWQPTIGEFIINIMWPLLVAFLVAFLFEPLRRWLSWTRNFLLDRISSLSSNLRTKRIEALELEIKNLNEYDDRTIMVLFWRSIGNLVFYFGFIMFVNIVLARLEISLGTNMFLKVPIALGVAQGQYHHFVFYFVLLYVAMNIILLGMFFRAVTLANIMFQKMDDIADIPKAIKYLEFRIAILRAKNT